MPVYLCQPGEGQVDPWRHGVQVFSAPWPIHATASPAVGGNNERDLVMASSSTNNGTNSSTNGEDTITLTNWHTAATASNDPNESRTTTTTTTTRLPSVRRVRHAELVLVDDVCIAYNRYWLRLRWPGLKGGFAGYIAMGLISETTSVGACVSLLFSLLCVGFGITEASFLTPIF
jgi:hypothetical protein